MESANARPPGKMSPRVSPKLPVAPAPRTTSWPSALSFDELDPTSPVPPMTTILILSLSRSLGALESAVRVYS
jgi:hypothetical protein